MKPYRYSRYTFKCDNPECLFEWDTINRHDIYCGVCRGFGKIIGYKHIERSALGEEKIISQT